MVLKRAFCLSESSDEESEEESDEEPLAKKKEPQPPTVCQRRVFVFNSFSIGGWEFVNFCINFINIFFHIG